MDAQTERVNGFEVQAHGLRKSFAGVEVLHGVDLTATGGSVLALLGENGAGKSTTVKIIAGDYRKDAGEIFINGERVDIRTPRDAGEHGIRIIHQEFSDAPDLTVAENLSLGALPVSRFGLVDWSAVRARAERILGELGIELDPNATVGSLGVAQRQILEIARALASEAQLLVLDEPTSALTIEETETLFRFIERLRDQGVAIVYITHRLDEVEQIADRLLVFRDGYVVAEGPLGDFSRSAIVEAMVGSVLEEELEELEAEGVHEAADREIVLQMSGARSRGLFRNVDLEVHAGEIVALFGRLGCGALEVAESVFGLQPLDGGRMAIAGREGHPKSPAEAIEQYGVGFVPVDRKVDGLMQNLSVADNLSVASWSKLAKFGVLAPKSTAAVFDEWKGTLDIRGKGGAAQIVETLSGGNQQKVVLGRWLARESRLLVLAEPTRGVDVGARAEIYRVLREFADRGMGVLMVSSDIEEVLRISDRILVMVDGELVAVHRRSEVDRAQLTREAAASDAAHAAG